LLGDDSFARDKRKNYNQMRVMHQLEELGASHHIVSIDNVIDIIQYVRIYHLFNTFLRNYGQPLQLGLSMNEVAGRLAKYLQQIETVPYLPDSIENVYTILGVHHNEQYREILKSINLSSTNLEFNSAIYKTPRKKREDDGTLRRLTLTEEMDDDIEVSRCRSEEEMAERAEEFREKRKEALRRAREITDDQIIAQMSGEEPFSDVELHLLLSLI